MAGYKRQQRASRDRVKRQMRLICALDARGRLKRKRRIEYALLPHNYS